MLSILDLAWHPNLEALLSPGSPLEPGSSSLVLTQARHESERIDVSTSAQHIASQYQVPMVLWPCDPIWQLDLSFIPQICYQILFPSVPRESNFPNNQLKCTKQITGSSSLPDPLQSPLSQTKLCQDVLETHIRTTKGIDQHPLQTQILKK